MLGAADLQLEGFALGDSEPGCGARRHDRSAWLREPARHGCHAAAGSGAVRACVGHDVVETSAAAPDGGVDDWVNADELHRLASHVDIAFHDRCELDGRGGSAQPDVHALIDAARTCVDFMGGGAVDRFHRQLERASGARGGNVHRDDGADAECQAEQCECELRRMTQQVPCARRPQRAHQAESASRPSRISRTRSALEASARS